MARDESITSLALTLSIDGYSQRPYSTAAIQPFITTLAKHREGKEKSAKTEKVSHSLKETESVRVVLSQLCGCILCRNKLKSYSFDQKCDLLQYVIPYSGLFSLFSFSLKLQNEYFSLK